MSCRHDRCCVMADVVSSQSHKPPPCPPHTPSHPQPPFLTTTLPSPIPTPPFSQELRWYTARTIQRVVRGYNGRKLIEPLKQARELQRLNRLTVVIQRLFRGFRSRLLAKVRDNNNTNNTH